VQEASRESMDRRALRPAMAWLHTWLGVLVGWLLYFMFVTGTLGYLDTEIDRWMRPELPAAQYPLPPAAPAEQAIAYLQAHASGARRWVVQLPVDRNEPYLSVSWQPQDGEGQEAQSVWLDVRSGERIEVRDTSGGQLLYQMHWRLHYLPQWISEWVVAFASMALLLALLTGIVVHRRFFADFFTLRLGKGNRSWLDAHNVASVLTLPFQLMISYSGLVFLMFSFMPLIASAWYGASAGAGRAFYSELFPPMAAAPATGQRTALVPVAQVLHDAATRWDGAPVAVLEIQQPGDANARISVIGNFAAGPVRSAGILVYDGVTGDLLAERPAWQSTPRASRDLLLGLHEGLFAGPILRALYLLSGLLGCVMVGTGMVLWTVKRRERATREPSSGHVFGHVLVERLNVAATLGLPVAIAAYFWANRLLPLGMGQRAEAEVHVMFLAWLVTLVHAALGNPSRTWRTQAWVAAFGFGALPLLNAATTHRHLAHALPAGDWVMAGFDLAALSVGMAFACAAHGIRRRENGA
jgi:uncharacterized iron-regulated membrane protein